MNNIGSRIKSLRNEKNITQEEFGKKFGIVKSTVSLYESNKSTPDDNLKKEMAKYFNVSLDYLMGVSDIRNPYITVDTNEKANDLSNEILDLLVEMGEISEDEIKTGSIDDKKANELLDKIKKAIKVSQIFKE